MTFDVGSGVLDEAESGGDLMISRRALMRLAGGAAAFASTRSFAMVNGVVHAQQAAGGGLDWTPIFLDRSEAWAVARMCEAIIPRTDTPGAIDADVPTYVDLVLSLESDSVQKRFRDRLGALEQRCRRDFGDRGLADVTTEELNRLLSSISDQVSGLPEEDRGLQALFKDVKRHTIVGYYTSLEGRTEELDLPARIQRVQWQGCSDAAHQRSAG